MDTPTEDEDSGDPLGRILKENIQVLMTAHPDLSSNPTLGKKSKLGPGAISRVRNNVGNVTLKSLAALAAAFDLEPWQLLVPGLKPEDLPVIQMANQKERELYERFKTVAKEIVQIEGPKS